MALFNLTELKSYLAITGTDEDDQLQFIVDGVNQAAVEQLEREIESAEGTEYYDGHDDKLLILRRRPVTAVAGVWVDPTGYAGQGANAFASTTEWTAGRDFFIRSTDENEDNGAIIESISRVWPFGRMNIKVTYTAGYSVVPDDLKLALLKTAAIARKKIDIVGDISGETIGSYSYSIAQNISSDPLLSDVAAVLSHYAEKTIGF
jgi:hypothetical protein